MKELFLKLRRALKMLETDFPPDTNRLLSSKGIKMGEVLSLAPM